MKVIVAIAILATLGLIAAAQIDDIMPTEAAPVVVERQPPGYDKWDQVVADTQALAVAQARADYEVEVLHRQRLMYGVPRDVGADLSASWGLQQTHRNYWNPYRRWRVDGDPRWRTGPPDCDRWERLVERGPNPGEAGEPPPSGRGDWWPFW